MSSSINIALRFRHAALGDTALLAGWNHQLIRDEGHRNTMSVTELEERMRGWLAGEYRAVVFEDGKDAVAYALYREQADEIYLRQLFVVRHRRRQGIGRAAFDVLRAKIWPKMKRLTVEVLVANESAVAFWRALGYRDYSLTLEIMPSKGRSERRRLACRFISKFSQASRLRSHRVSFYFSAAVTICCASAMMLSRCTAPLKLSA